jgi:hypothetical protein
MFFTAIPPFKWCSHRIRLTRRGISSLRLESRPLCRGPARFLRECLYPVAAVFAEMALTHTNNFRIQHRSISLASWSPRCPVVP